MSFTLINRSFFSLLSLLFLFSCTTNTVYEKITPKTYEVPLVETIDDGQINIININSEQINYENELLLKDFKNETQYFNNIITENDGIYAYKDNNIYNFASITFINARTWTPCHLLIFPKKFAVFGAKNLTRNAS